MCRINASRLFFGYVAITANIAIMLFLQKKAASSIAELGFILLAIIFAFMILQGYRKNSEWIWPSMILFLAMALANNVYLFIAVKNMTLFVFVILLNLFGMVLGLIWSLEEESEMQTCQKSTSFETYYDESEPQNIYSAAELISNINKKINLSNSTKRTKIMKNK